ncbi:5-carboxymethyl-2-hydroxymuconate Delta-isomerase [Acinetobacter sp. ANC 5502]
MPHLVIGYSRNIHNLSQEKLLKHVNHQLIATGLFQAKDLKSRIHDEVFVIGDNDDTQGYIHAQLSVLSGRTEEQKQQLSQILLQALLSFKDYEAYTLSVQVSAEILEMPQNQYAKQSTQY